MKSIKNVWTQHLLYVVLSLILHGSFIHAKGTYCVSGGITTDHERKFKYGLRFKFATHMYVVQSYFYKFNMFFCL